MRARCYRCQATFDTDHFGAQRCPSCNAEVFLPDPASQPAPTAPAPAPTPPPAVTPPPASPTPPPPGSATPGWGPPPGWTPPPGPPPGWSPLPPGVAPPVDERSAPFAERASRGFFPAFWETWKLVATEPTRFFRAVRVAESRAAVLFGVISLTLGMWVSLAIGYLTASAQMSFMARLSARMGGGKVETAPILDIMKGATPGGLLIQAIVTPLFALLSIYIMSGVLHLALLMVRGAPRGFDATLTLVGYACGLFLLEALPICGGLIAMVWFCFVAIHGLAEVQRCGTGKAAFAVLTPVLLMCLCACLAGLVAGFAGLAGGFSNLGAKGGGGGSVGL